MSTREILRNIVDNVECGAGAVIMGYDGIPIDEYIKPDSHIDVGLMAVEYASVMKEIRRTVEVLKTGGMDEVSIITEHSFLIVRVINDDFFLVLVLAEEGNFGKGRYLLKRYIAKLSEILM
jgi:predicted regulator of Ras-like GTPase activity (Roadblock/LC7/MglB family)